jgi:hypothetical protein
MRSVTISVRVRLVSVSDVSAVVGGQSLTRILRIYSKSKTLSPPGWLRHWL